MIKLIDYSSEIKFRRVRHTERVRIQRVREQRVREQRVREQRVREQRARSGIVR